MIYALYFLALIGAVVVLVAAIFGACLVREAFLDWRREPHFRSFLDGREFERNRLLGESWWFSESPETHEMIADLARGRDVSDVREKWRKARAAKETEVAK